jgi:hypothetical protein
MLLEHTSVTTTTTMARVSSPRGEHWNENQLVPSGSGSSPRVRGTQKSGAFV